MPKRVLRTGFVVVLVALAAALAWPGKPMKAKSRASHASKATAAGAPEFGDPLAGVNPAEFELFNRGLDAFLEVEEPEDGLGPFFNGRSCGECHSTPAVGGSGTILEI